MKAEIEKGLYRFQPFPCENVATKKGFQLDFYWIAPAAQRTLLDLPFWHEEICSVKLYGISLKNFFDRNQAPSPNILHIVTEGNDRKKLS